MNKTLLFFIFIVFQPLLLFSQEYDSSALHSHLPHPVNATMGLPGPVGSYNFRINAFRQQNDSTTEMDISGHLSYGFFKWGGIHFRSLGIKTTPFTEVIGKVRLWQNTEGTKGFSFLGIVGIPTGSKKEDPHHENSKKELAYFLGFSGRLAKQNFFSNDFILHYDFLNQHFISENGTVLKITPSIFASLDFQGTFGASRPVIYVLPSVKLKLRKVVFIALGFQSPLTNAATYKNQIIFQLEIGNH